MDNATLLAAQDVSQRGERGLHGLFRDGDGPLPREACVVCPAGLLSPYTVVEQSREVRQRSRMLCWQARRIRFHSPQLQRQRRERQRQMWFLTPALAPPTPPGVGPSPLVCEPFHRGCGSVVPLSA